MVIRKFDELIKLLGTGGWEEVGFGWLKAPYNYNIRIHRFDSKKRHFYQLRDKGCDYIIGTISNLQNANWTYSKDTGLLTNELCAIRIK